MADLLHNAMQKLTGLMKAHASQTVAYVRKGQSGVDVPATLGLQRHAQDDGNGRIVRTETRDFVFPTEDLFAAAGESFDPREGDRIEYVVGVQRYIYGVYSPNATEQPFRFCDPYHTAIRVHTQLDHVEEVTP